MSAIGPLKGLVRVRVGSQRVRRALEVELEQRLTNDRATVVILRPPKRSRPYRDAPLSWALGDGDIERLRRDWDSAKSGPEMAVLRGIFAAPAHDP